ncbi:type II toxin-antitoxin system RelE/ParE family toxin [Burkholderia sp. Ac-20379]|uniref:type II toxin-antitoxin system RelE/ParE family toxin n=1 Tax=Burkholderia sp. Ac-20379 TaxID=2703900 RepID=UPI001980E7E9|nr:type II toxin-antitoxin system RelE/ParE family toxin [Burkholderia sp. Ac-20379]MBN3728523.1 type II toxin-antitoxin system RelE/ParE family toxin [Burkholderia sp. Ac-20379]
MIDIFTSVQFESWLAALRDTRARARIVLRIRRLSLGNPGDVKPVGHGISEMRIDYGPGYRVYYLQRGLTAVLLLCGGNKSTQPGDIVLARSIALQWQE